MITQSKLGLSGRSLWNSTSLIICAIALLSFLTGVLLAPYLSRPKSVEASGERVFELMIYHTVPGKVPDLESDFRDSYKLQAKHGLNVIGYWVPNEDPAWSNTFIYLIAHPSRAEADANWHALHSDPEFAQYRNRAVPLIEQVNGDYRVDEIFMRPSDFSRMK